MIEFERISEKEAGLPEGSTENFIRALVSRGVNLHSVILMKDGRLLTEKYAPGFDENFRHRLYSVSKTFVSAAVGIAVGEGYFRLDSHVADFFADKCPGNLHPYLENLTVRDCLMMATPFECTPYDHTHEDWVWDFFNARPTHRGGTLFMYDTGASLVLDALVARVTGMNFNEYLYEKCLKKLGFDILPECVEEPGGVKWGGSGLFCTTREFAAVARLFMNGGRADDGTQLIPEDYVKAATSKQNGNAENNVRNALRGKGYGYQTWMLEGGWAMYGMGNQLAFCYPDEGLLFVCTGDDQGNDFARNYIIDFLDEMLLRPLGRAPKKLPEKAELTMPLHEGEKHSPTEKAVSGIVYKTEESRTGIEKISFVFEGDEGEMKFFARGEEKSIRFGLGHFTGFSFPEKGYSGMRINTPIGRGYRSFGGAVWDLPDLLVLKVYAADTYFGVMTVNIRFTPGGIDLRFTKTAEWFFEEYTGFVTGSAE